MAINGKFTKKVNGELVTINPKTTADAVEYANNQSVKQKIDSLDTITVTISNEVATLQGGMKYVSSTSDMVDTTKAYVNTDDNKWYYYDESTNSWVTGGEVAGVIPDTTLSISGAAADAAVVGSKIYKIEFVDTLPATGNANTFYLISKGEGKGYDKYWYITDTAAGTSKWDAFSGSSTEVVNSLPQTGDEDVDYILTANNGYFYYKWINNDWSVIGGSMATVVDDIDNLPQNGNELTDYYVAQSNGSYQHYRWKDAEDENDESGYHIVGGDSYTKSEVDTLLTTINGNIATNTSNISTLNTTVGSIQSSLATANADIDEIQQTLDDVDNQVYKYNVTYGTAVVEGEEKENVFRLYQYKGDDFDEEDEENIIQQFIIQGGSGGASATNLNVQKITSSPVTVTPSDNIVIEYTYSSTDGDGDPVDGTYTWKLDNAQIANGTLVQGRNTFDATNYISTAGTYSLTLTVRDAGGSVTSKSWKIIKVDMRVESNFSDSTIYNINSDINFNYTPYGAIQKTIHIKLDGEEIVTEVSSVSGIEQIYTIDADEYGVHGSHLIECYMTATINGTNMETDHVYKSIIWSDEGNEEAAPIVACSYIYDLYGKLTAKQYNTTSIPFFVYDPAYERPTVVLKEDNVVVDEKQVETRSNVWTYTSSTIGEHTLEISCRGTSVTLKIDIEDIGIAISPVTGGLQFDFNPIGLSNDSNNRLWHDSNTDVNMTVSQNFDWNNGGYKTDNEGNQYFCIKSGTTATFNYKLFNEDANPSVYGAEFKCVFKTTNVKRADATFLNCVAGTIPVGLQMNVHEAYLKTSNGSLHIPYSENDIIEFEFNINPIGDADDAVIMSYEDGVALRPMLYMSGTRLYQYKADAIPLTFGSPDCDVYIYRMKAYNTALSDANILNNFIADSRNATTMLARYDRNQIYNENNILTPESVAHACPQLRVIKIDCPYFTNDKNNYVKGTNVQCIYEDGDPVLDNWQFNNCYHSGQGTSSNKYGISGRNIDIVMCADGKDQISSKINKTAAAVDPNYITELILGDGTTYSYNGNLPYDEDTNNRDKVKVSLSRTSVPNNWFNIKVNIASSENANNALLQKRFNDFLPYTTIAMDNDPKCKNSMEFYNCVIFVRENNADLTTHREFNDTDWHFYAIGNIGDSKKTDATRVNNINDIKEFVIEFSDNTLPNTTFQTGVYWADAEKTQTTFDVTESVAGMKYPITKEEWQNENNITRKCLYDNYSYMRLNDKNEEEEVFVTWDTSFEFRYDMGGDTKDGATIQTTSEEKAAQRLRNKQILRDFYEWVITCPDNRFATELEGWFIKDSALYWYLFTERYTMIDNRAKNTFYHFADIGSYHIVPYPNSLFMDMYYEKDGDEYTLTEDVAVDSNKTYYWRYAFEMWDYDNDTALGIDNNGDMVFPYGKEDTDTLNGIAVFNAAGSVFWCRIRDLMYNDLATLYKRIDNESPNCWDSESLITQFDTWQEQFPEELWRLDIQRKYYRVYLAQSIDNSIIPIDKETGKIVKDSSYLTTKLNGRKRYHRRQFERSQATYIASKYKTESSEANTIWFRACQKDENSSIDANYSLSLTPYSDMYINIEVGNTSGDSTTFRRRALAGQTYTFIVPEILLSDGDAMVSIFYSNHIQAINDLSKFYMKGNNFSAGTRLQRLIIGNSTEGYVNNNITSISLNSPLLEELDIRNCPNFSKIIGLARCTSLKTFYAENTALTSAEFAVNGKLETTHLPITVNTLSLRSLNNLTEFQFGYSDEENHYDNLEALTIENTNIDEIAIIDDCLDTLKNLTVTGINWTLDDKSLLDSIYALVDRSYLAGRVHITGGSIRTSDIAKYNAKWPDLSITYEDGILVLQFKVTYKIDSIDNDGNGDVILGEVYVDQNSSPPNIGFIGSNTLNQDEFTEYGVTFPTKHKTIEQVFHFDHWNADDLNVTVNNNRKIVTAVFTSVPRTYTVRWFAHPDDEEPVQVATGIDYGAGVEYNQDESTETNFDTGEKFADKVVRDLVDGAYICRSCSLFTGKWDKSTSMVLDDIDVYGIWESAVLPQRGKDLSEMSFAEMYTIVNSTDLCEYDEETNPNGYFQLKDHFDFEFDSDKKEVYIHRSLPEGEEPQEGHYYGVDIVKDGVYVYGGEEEEQETFFDNDKVIDTGIKLFDADSPSFILAIQFNTLTGSSANNSSNSIISCNDYAKAKGFYIYKEDYSNHGYPVFYYCGGTTKKFSGETNYNDSSNKYGHGSYISTMVIKHAKGSKDLYLYSNYVSLRSSISTNANDHVVTKLTRSTDITTENITLLLGGMRVNSDNVIRYGAGCIYNATIWYNPVDNEYTNGKFIFSDNEIYNIIDSYYPNNVNKYRMELYGFNLYNVSGSDSLVNMSFMSKTLSYVNNSTSEFHGIQNAYSPFRLDYYYDRLPRLLKKIIKPVQLQASYVYSASEPSTPSYPSSYTYSESAVGKYTYSYSSSSNLYTRTGYKLYMPSWVEFTGKNQSSYNSNVINEGKQIPYLVDDNVNNIPNTIIRQSDNATKLSPNIMRIKYRNDNMWVDDSATIYIYSVDPSDVDDNIINHGDIWVKASSYIYYYYKINSPIDKIRLNYLYINDYGGYFELAADNKGYWIRPTQYATRSPMYNRKSKHYYKPANSNSMELKSDSSWYILTIQDANTNSDVENYSSSYEDSPICFSI